MWSFMDVDAQRRHVCIHTGMYTGFGRTITLHKEPLTLRTKWYLQGRMVHVVHVLYEVATGYGAWPQLCGSFGPEVTTWALDHDITEVLHRIISVRNMALLSLNLRVAHTTCAEK